MTIQKQNANVKDLNLNFIGGELSKSHWGNFASNFYSTSVKLAENMIGLSTGAMRKRLGTILLEKSEAELVTYNWNNHDIIFRKKDLNSTEYKIYKEDGGLTVVKDWTAVTGLDWANIYDLSVILARSQDILFGSKTGLYKIDVSDYLMNLQTITQPDGRTVQDFANAVVFNDTLVTFDSGYVYNSRFTSFTDFKLDTGTNVNAKSPAYAPVSVFEPSGKDIISTKTINNYIVVATTHGIYVVRRTLVTVNEPPTYFTTFIADYVALRGGVIIIGGAIYICTEDGIYIIGADEFEQISDVSGLGSASRNNSYRATTFKLYSITVYCEHVFLKDKATRMIAYTKRRVSNPDIIYGLRNDGVIICFTLVQPLVKGTGLQAPITTRRTCKGIYNWICPNNLSTTVSLREVNDNKKEFFVEKEIYRNYCDDNQTTLTVADYQELNQYLFLDCGFIANGREEQTSLYKNSLLRVNKGTGYKAGDHIVLIVKKLKVVYEITSIESTSSNFFDFITLHMPANNHNPLVEGTEYIIRAKMIGESVKQSQEYTDYKTKTANVLGIMEFSHNLARDGIVNGKLPVSTYNYSTGIGYTASLKFLHATMTTKVERLELAVTTLETQFAITMVSGEANGYTETPLSSETVTHGSTNLYTYNVGSISGYQTIVPDITIKAIDGENLIVLNTAYIITRSTFQS